VLGANEPVWLLDPRDAQYLDCSAVELSADVDALKAEGLLQPAKDAGFASPMPKLMDRRDSYLEQLARTLQFIKPSFNEEMRAGQTNM
jgi:hypothetical protein